jgi:dihydrolipoamide dehydrogenase
MTRKSTDILIIGAGPGGYTAAFLAADKGRTVTLVDASGSLGGVCLHAGCIPSKALLHAVKILSDCKNAEQLGITFQDPQINFHKLNDWKQDVINKLVAGLDTLCQQRKVTFLQGKASFLSKQCVKVRTADNQNEEITFENAIIAAGSRPCPLPGAPVSASILNSQSALNVTNIPSRLLIIGGGYIGLEMATIYAGLGSEVSVVEQMPEILSNTDPDLVRMLKRRLKKDLRSLSLATSVTEISETADGLSVALQDKKGKSRSMTYDKILVAIGRHPNTEDLDLQNAGIIPDAKGLIPVSAQQQTANPAVYAIGDVTDGPLLAHKAAAEGKTAVRHICGEYDPESSQKVIPSVIFTDPEIACVGLTEQQAREQNVPVDTAQFRWPASGRALTQDRTDGMTKLIIDPSTEKILGVGIVGMGAGDLIMEGALAIHMGGTAKDIQHLIHPHPSLSETLMEAAEIFTGTCTHIYKPTR